MANGIILSSVEHFGLMLIQKFGWKTKSFLLYTFRVKPDSEVKLVTLVETVLG